MDYKITNNTVMGSRIFYRENAMKATICKGHLFPVFFMVVTALGQHPWLLFASSSTPSLSSLEKELGLRSSALCSLLSWGTSLPARSTRSLLPHSMIFTKAAPTRDTYIFHAWLWLGISNYGGNIKEPLIATDVIHIFQRTSW